MKEDGVKIEPLELNVVAIYNDKKVTMEHVVERLGEQKRIIIRKQKF